MKNIMDREDQNKVMEDHNQTVIIKEVECTAKSNKAIDGSGNQGVENTESREHYSILELEVPHIEQNEPSTLIEKEGHLSSKGIQITNDGKTIHNGMDKTFILLDKAEDQKTEAVSVEKVETKIEMINGDTSLNENNDPLRSTPTIPNLVYHHLPDLLVEAAKHFTDVRERDVVITSSLIILSGCFASCEGQYSNDWLGPNMFGFIVAPPASGKGSMKFARALGSAIQEEFLSLNKTARANYDVEMKVWKKASKKNAVITNPPVKPKYPVHFIPGNSSASSIYRMLEESDGIGTICESEADTLTGAIKQDWGNFSHILRCSFHHEELSISRMKDDQYSVIQRPHLSTLLTGTPEQVPRLIASTEDGLCSRFLFYCYSREMEWINPAPCTTCVDLSKHFEVLGKKVQAMKVQLDIQKPIFSLTSKQFALLSKNFKKKLERVKLFEGADAASAVYRLGNMAFRMAMILTILRNSSNKMTANLVCQDKDFIVAMKLIDVYFEHAMVLYSLLPKRSKKVINATLGRFYMALPKDGIFARKKADEIGTSQGISEKSVGNYLAKLKTEGHITSPTYGKYEVVQ